MNFNKKLAVAVSGAVLLMAGQFALADSTTDIVDALVSKGVLTEEEGKLITKGHTSKVEKTPTVKEKDGAFVLSSPNGKNSIQLTGRLHFDAKYNTTDKQDLFSDSFGPWAQDGDSKSMASHYNARRARLGVKGRLGGIADYELVGNFAGTPGIDVAYLDINKYEPIGFTFGRFKVAPNLEIKTSSNNIDMIERSYVSQNVPEKKFGAAIHGEFTGLTYFGSAFQNNDSALSQKDHSLSTAGRGTVNFAEIMGNKDAVLHIGLNGYSSNYEVQPQTTNNVSDDKDPLYPRATIFSFAAGGQGVANAYRAQIGDTFRALGTSSTGMGNAQYGMNANQTASVHSDNLGLEAIAAYNNFKLQGEYSSAFYKAGSSGGDEISASVDTWYAEALWIMTGEKYSDAYKKGAFGLVKPKNEFNMDSGSGLGLWEIGARVDAFDVTDTNMFNSVGNNSVIGSRFQGAANSLDAKKTTCSGTSYTSGGVTGTQDGAGCGGGAKSYTASIKWVMNPNMLIKANWTHTKFDNEFSPIDLATSRGVTNTKPINSEDLLMIRGQWMF
jgi:phosphate-selective porin OprO/OprP